MCEAPSSPQKTAWGFPFLHEGKGPGAELMAPHTRPISYDITQNPGFLTLRSRAFLPEQRLIAQRQGTLLTENMESVAASEVVWEMRACPTVGPTRLLGTGRVWMEQVRCGVRNSTWRIYLLRGT